MWLLAKPSQNMFLLAGAALTNKVAWFESDMHHYIIDNVDLLFPVHINYINLLERAIEKSFLKCCQSNLKTTSNCSKNQLTWAQIK